MSTSENEHAPGASKEIEEEGNELVKGPPVDTREAPPDTPGTHEIGTHYQPVSTTEEDLLGIESPSNDDGAEDDIAQLPNPGEWHSAICEATHPAVGLGDSNIQKLKELDIPLQKTEASGKSRSREKSLPPPPLPLKDHAYQDSTPKTPLISRSPTRTQSDYDSYNEKIGLDEPDAPPDYEENEKQSQTQKQEQEPSSINAEDSESEIQSIIGQFQDEEGAANEEDVKSPRLDLAGQLLGGAMQYPPRRSSLEPLRSPVADREDPPTSPWVSSPPLQSPGQRMQRKFSSQSLTPHSPSHFAGPTPTGMAEGPSSPASLPHPPPPEPEPDQPFDFHRFLEQLRHRTADPVAKFLRSFLTEFGKKQWMVHEQVKIISDFLAFITNKMAQCEIWRGVSDAEFDNAKEGMEKLVMNRLYTQTFSPAIPPPPPPPRSKGKRKEIERMTTPGRRGQHQEDVERDEILAQKVRIYGWVTEEHLEIPEVGPNGRRFLTLAQQELLKIKGYRAPRDKIICVLNCCKVIFGLLKHAKTGDTSADSFVPLLILVVLQANPEHLVSNVQYILRFRNQDKLGGEAGYYLSSLMGAIQFIETLDRTTLTISDEDFEKNVEAAVSAIAERHREIHEPPALNQPVISEKSSLSGPEVTPRNSMDAEYSSPRKRDGNSTSIGDSLEENVAVAGLLRSIQRPLSTIGRIFSDDTAPQRPSHPASTPRPGSTPRLSPAVFQTPRNSGEGRRSAELALDGANKQLQDRNNLNAEDAAARQASAEVAEARRIQRAEHKDVVETLSGMFPNLDKDIIDDVVRMKEGRVGLAVDACLALSAES